MLIDTHCHIQFKGLKNDRENILATCREKGMLLNVVGTQQDTSRAAVEFARDRDDAYVSIGTHPNHLFPTHIVEEESEFVSREEGFDHEYYEELYALAPHKIIAAGETGIDLYHVPEDIPVEEVLKKQREVFLEHVIFAEKHDLPLVIHCRDAHDQLIETIETRVQESGQEIRGVIHCYTGNWEHAKKYLDLGLYLGFTGVITFPPKKTDPRTQEDLLEVVRNMPLDRIVVETDAPYLAPQAYRGKRCEPWMVEEVIAKIAEVRNMSAKDVEKHVEQNTRRLFPKIQDT